MKNKIRFGLTLLVTASLIVPLSSSRTQAQEPAPATPEAASPADKTASKKAVEAEKKAVKKKVKTEKKSAQSAKKKPAKTSAPKTVKVPPALAAIEEKYVKASTMSAEFSQVNETAATQQKKTSSGVISLKHPYKVRWETLKPDKSLYVSDGKTFWFYTPPFDEDEKGQVIQKRTTEAQSKLANALLSGSFSTAPIKSFEQQSPTHFVLVPTKGSGGTVTKIEIDVDPAKSLIEKVLLIHEGGNKSTISLSKIALGEDIPDEIFSFVPPPGTERI